MKFSIRFADQIVGAFIILALGILIFVVFMLGSSQRWFSRDYQYLTYLNSAVGVSPNMPVLYKGFTIGRIKGMRLSEDDRVEVVFVIFDTYNDRVREGSLVEVVISPFGLGNQFVFYPGTGTVQLEENSIISTVSSVEGRRLLAAGLAIFPERDDSIGNIMNLASSTLSRLNETLADLQKAIEGTNETSLGRTLGSVEAAASAFKDMPASLDSTIKDLKAPLDPILKNINELSSSLADPSGTVMEILDGDGHVYSGLLASLDSISGILRNLERTSEFIPAQLPQVASILADLQNALRTAEDVLVALTNNPLLRRGIPQRMETGPGGTRPRDIEF
jgi:phospholipid/cholesterol/gamma-HCH transport system substrate-binding protein